MANARTHRQLKLHDGRILGYTEYGAPKGMPIFYFHGFPGSRLDYLFFDASEAAVGANARIIAADRPGYGLSSFQRGRKILDWPDDVTVWRTVWEHAATRATQLLLDSTLHVGVNLLVTPTLLPQLSQVLARLQALGVWRVTVLRPKPPVTSAEESLRWYEANRLCRTDLLRLRDVLNAWQRVLELEVDSALVGLMGRAQSAHVCWWGVYGCAAGRRICTVWPDGRVTPCSFLADPSGLSPSGQSLSAGNVRQTPFAALWARGQGWGLLRSPAARRQRGCTDCEVVLQCGGARCVARYQGGNLLAGDAECPQSQVL